jgi:two-component system, OmpR family, sensor histidine kinase KdpD
MSRHGATLVRAGLWIAISLALCAIGVGLLEDRAGVANASPLFLVAVVVCGLATGTGGAILTAIGASLVYNYFFTEPLYTFEIGDPGVLLSVLVLLFVGIVVGQLAALQRARAETAEASEREARALFGVSRVLATRASTDEALGHIAALLREHGTMARVRIALGPDPGTQRVAADTSSGDRPPPSERVRVLQRAPGDEPARWTLVHRAGGVQRPRRSGDTYMVRIEASGELLGSILAERTREAGEPDRTQTRLLAGAADQIGQALARDRAAAEAKAAEVARRSDALKSSLLQSVSHDFRTPLAVIRAAAGGLDADPAPSLQDRRESAAAIEREVEYLNRLVANLLDLSRIQAGSLTADRDVYDLEDLATEPVERARGRLGGRLLDTAIDPALVEVDPVFVDAALANLLDNAIKYTPDEARIRIVGGALDTESVVLTIEDDGPGVPPEALPHLFETFYRVPGVRGGSRAGLGIGLAVVRGLVEATGGRVAARRSELGGLAIDLVLPAAAATSPGGAS